MGTVKKPSGKSNQDVMQQEDVIEAVVVADSFSVRFAPITDVKPKALLPLVNRPMIDYTLEFLLLSGVQKTFIFCVSHAEQIKEYLKNSKWTRPISPMAIHVLSSPNCCSLGDALREIDSMSIIRKEFILLNSFVVSNAQLIPILEKHKERKTADKDLLMTHIFAQSFPGHRTKAVEEEFLMAVNPKTDQILHFQRTPHLKKIGLPFEIFKENMEVELRYDLIDTHISICSPTVLPLFSDNFDYQTWDDFVRGVLINDEIMGNNIYFHQLQQSYGAQVSNIHMYDAISKDIIRRYTYPLVPDMNCSSDVPRHTLSRHNVYKQPNVALARGSVLEMNVVVGEGTVIGEEAHVSDSVIGSRCRIGNDVSIADSFVWNNVLIKDGCRIATALIADDVVLNERVVLGRGCVIGPGVSLAPGTVVPPSTRLMAQPQEDEFGSSEDVAKEPFSAGSQAYLYQAPSEDDSDAESLVEELWGVDQDAEDDWEDDDEMGEEEEGDGEEEEEGDVAHVLRSESSPLPEETRHFFNEALESLQRGFEEKISCENLVTEINCSKHAYNVSIDDVNTFVTKSILSLPDILDKKRPAGSSAYFRALKPILQFYIPLFRNYMKNKESQLQCLSALEDYGSSHADFAPCIGQVLNTLYDADVLCEEAITEWFEDVEPDSPTRKPAEAFVKWLQEAEEESDEEDSD